MFTKTQNQSKPVGIAVQTMREPERTASTGGVQSSVSLSFYQLAFCPGPLPANALRCLHQTAGNRVMQRMLAEIDTVPIPKVAEEEGGNIQLRPAQTLPSTAQANQKPNQTGLPDDLKAGLETLSGFDLSALRVYKNSDKPAQLGALAYTQGSDIYVAPGQERHLPHEGWHAVQQMQGRVGITGKTAGLPLNDEPGLEKEADRMGIRAEGVFKIKSVETTLPQLEKSLVNRTAKRNNRILQCCGDKISQALAQFTHMHTWKYNGNPVAVGLDGFGLVARDAEEEIAFIQYKVNRNVLEISGFGNSNRIMSGKPNVYPYAGTMLLKQLLELVRGSHNVKFVQIVGMSGSYGYYGRIGFHVPQGLSVDTRGKNPGQIKSEERQKFLRWSWEPTFSEASQHLNDPVSIDVIEANVAQLLQGKGWQKIN
jgi:hypothetical protein